jgi:alcohol dehydrogenase (NADP+)
LGAASSTGTTATRHQTRAEDALLFSRRSLSGSLIGGIAETPEMLEFCVEHGITADVEVIPIQQINETYERMLRSDVKPRFSIDLTSLRDR